MTNYIISLATLIGINAILAVTLNFILGYAGIFPIQRELTLEPPDPDPEPSPVLIGPAHP